MSRPSIGDPRTTLLKLKAREEGFTDLEIMGLQNLAKAAWMIGASTKDIEANLQNIKPKCKKVLANPANRGEDIAKKGVCNELLAPADRPGQQRLLGGVFAKRVVNPKARFTKMARDIHASADKAALEKERERNLELAALQFAQSSVTSALTQFRSGDMQGGMNSILSLYTDTVQKTLQGQASVGEAAAATLVTKQLFEGLKKATGAFQGLLTQARSAATAEAAAEAAIALVPGVILSPGLYRVFKMAALAASIYGVDQYAKGYFGGRSVLAYISTSLIAGLRSIGTAIADGLTYMLEAVLNGNPNPSPPPAPAPPTPEQNNTTAERQATEVSQPHNRTEGMSFGEALMILKT